MRKLLSLASLMMMMGVVGLAHGHEAGDVRVSAGYVIDDGDGIGLASVHLSVENAGGHPIQVVAAASPLGALLLDEAVGPLAEGETQAFGEQALVLLLPARAQADVDDVFPLTLTVAMLDDDGTATGEELVVATAVRVVNAAPAVHPVLVTNAYALQTAAPADADTMPTTPGAVYMQLTNTAEDAVALVSAETDAAAVVELHETTVADGIGRMRAVEAIPLVEGNTVALLPGGLHIMLINMPRQLIAGDAFLLTLRFDDGSTQQVPVPILDPVTMGMGAHDHDHSGHNH